MVVKLLPDQPSHRVPARQWLVHIAFDEGPAVRHTVLHWAGRTQRWRMYVPGAGSSGGNLALPGVRGACFMSPLRSASHVV